MDREEREFVKSGFIMLSTAMILLIVLGVFRMIVSKKDIDSTFTEQSSRIEEIEERVSICEEQLKEEPVLLGEYSETPIIKDVDIEWNRGDFQQIDCDLDPELQEFAFNMCKVYDLDYSFIMAIMDTESGYNPKLISPTHDYGLMQINSCNHDYLRRELGITDFLDGKQNIIAGCFVVRSLFNEYETPEKVLMAYNMGEGGARSLWSSGIYSTSYVRKVLSKQSEILEGYANGEE